MAAHSAETESIACVVHFDCLHEKDLKVFSKVTEKSLEKIKEVISLCREANNVQCDVARKASSLLELAKMAC
jgi:hypothetical protein